jgi:hypothetical protein
MTARTRAPAALSTTLAVAALVAVVAVVLALRAPAAGADIGDESGGTNAGGNYSAWAWYTAAGGRDPVTTPDDCTLEDPDTADKPAHWEYEVEESATTPGTFIVSYGCTAELLHDRQFNQIGGFNDFELYDNLWTISVTPAPIEDLVARALATLDPQPPTIATDLQPGVDGLVHVPVEFRLTGDLGPQGGVAASAGPIEVVLTAWPDGNVPIVWHTGDGPSPCGAADGWGVCTHDYGRSSYGQHHEGLASHHYRITAGITYLGHYDVVANGTVIASADIGNVDRTVEFGLAVEEAQAVNTRG